MAGTTTKDKDILGRSGMLRRAVVSINNLVDDVEEVRGFAAVLTGSATFNPANNADGVGETTTVTVTGAVLGDFAQASFSLDLQGYTLSAYVSAADTVSVRFQNESGGALDLASGTLRARVIPFGNVQGAASTLAAAKIGGPDGTAVAA